MCEVVSFFEMPAHSLKQRDRRKRLEQLIMTLRHVVCSGQKAVDLLQLIFRTDLQMSEPRQPVSGTLERADYRRSDGDDPSASCLGLCYRLHRCRRDIESFVQRERMVNVH